MPYTHLISVDELKALQASGAPLLVGGGSPPQPEIGRASCRERV